MTEENKSYCFACGELIKSSSILICLECLDDETNRFFKLATDSEFQDLESDNEHQQEKS